jgi:hypothetical protein
VSYRAQITVQAGNGLIDLDPIEHTLLADVAADAALKIAEVEAIPAGFQITFNSMTIIEVDEPRPALPDGLADLTADWKAVRRVADVIAEVIDNAVEEVMTFRNVELTEENVEVVTDYVYALATTGKPPA